MFQRAMPGLLREQGFDYGSLNLVFDVYDLPKHQRAYYFDKALCVMGVISQKRKEESGKRH